MVATAPKEGGEILCGGKRPEEPELQKGFYFLPTVIGNVTENMTVFQEEIFGPVVTIQSFKVTQNTGSLDFF